MQRPTAQKITINEIELRSGQRPIKLQQIIKRPTAQKNHNKVNNQSLKRRSEPIQSRHRSESQRVYRKRAGKRTVRFGLPLSTATGTAPCNRPQERGCLSRRPSPRRSRGGVYQHVR